MIALTDLKKMERAGITLMVDMPSGGMAQIAPEEVSIYMADANAFWARRYGVSKETLAAWLEWRLLGDVQCTAKTVKGKQCGNYVPCPDSPVVYDPAGALCPVHDK